MNTSSYQKRYKHHLFICAGKSCSKVSNPEQTKLFFKEKIKALGLQDSLRACTSSCLDRCEESPNIVDYPSEKWYSTVTQADLEKIWKEITQE